jgi:DNA excision repair protein ERCC-8
MLSGGADSSIKIWDLDKSVPGDVNTRHIDRVDEIPRKTGHQFGVSAVLWWPFDNGLFVSSSFDGKVKVWDSSTLAEAYAFNLESKVYSVDVSTVGDHSLVATAADHPFLRLLDLRTTSSAHTLKAHSGRILSVKWSPTNANFLASSGSDGTVKLWDIRRSNSCVCSLDMHQVGDAPTKTPMSFRKAHRSSVNGLCWFPNGDYLISCGNDEKIRIWSLYPMGGKNMLINFGPLIRNRHLQTLNPCLSPDIDLAQPYLFFPSDSGDIFVLRSIDGKIVKRLYRGFHKTMPRTACIIARGGGSLEYYSGAFDGTITTWAPVLNEESEENSMTVADIWDTVGDIKL